jgi:hypothetical protein
MAFAALCLLPTAAVHAAEAGVSVDTATVYGTPQGTTPTSTGTTTVAAPTSVAPEPGQPEVKVSEPSSSVTPTTSANPPGPRVETPQGGRDDRKSFPWWILMLVVGAGIAVAAG